MIQSSSFPYHHQTLKAVKLNIPMKGILPSLCINESVTALNISNEIFHSRRAHYTENYIDIFYLSGTIHHDSVVTMFTQLFKLPHLNILHVHIKMFRSTQQSADHIDNELLVEMEKVLSTNHTIKEFLIKLSCMEFNSLINSLLTGVKRNDTIQFFSQSSDSTHTKSLHIEELLKKNKTLQAVKLDIPIKGMLLSLCITS